MNHLPSATLTLASISHLVLTYPKSVCQRDLKSELNERIKFLDFLGGLLAIDPAERWSPEQAKTHPFISGGQLISPIRDRETVKLRINFLLKTQYS